VADVGTRVDVIDRRSEIELWHFGRYFAV
jgi:hypothetical protein